MSTTITFRRGTGAPTQGAGLTLGEPAFDTTNRNFYIGLGHGVTAAWVGARISGASADIAAGLTNWIVNAKAVKDYVSTVSGVTPGDAVTWTQLQTFSAGISAAGGITFNGIVNGATATFSRLVTGNAGFSGALTGTATNASALGGTAASGWAQLAAANTFTALNSFTIGISAAGGTFANDIRVNSLTVGRGGGSVATNTALGINALSANVSGGGNVAVGWGALQGNSGGASNTAIGQRALGSIEDGSSLTAVGDQAFRQLLGGSAGVALGYMAGRYYGSGNDLLENSSNSIYVGYESRAASDGTDNEIVIGASALGQGSNSTTIGTSATTLTRLYGLVQTNGGVSAAGATFSGNVLVGATLTVSGNLIVNGTTTTINSATISVDDKNIVLADTDTPSDTAADGGGITLKGTGDKTFYWKATGFQAADEVNNAWNTNQNFNLTNTAGKYYIEAYEVLSRTALGSTVVGSSLSSVGTITSGTWNSDIVYVDGGTYT